MSTTYRITAPDAFVTDGAANARLLHDLPKDDEELYAAALVASGDYFVMLAATLEEIACALPETHAEQYRLQYLVGQLLYLQRRYKVIKKGYKHPDILN